MLLEGTYKRIENTNYIITNTGLVINTKTKRIIKQQIINSGYCIVKIRKNKKQITCFAHRLVAAYFIGDVARKTVNHIDGNKLNNHETNLEILSHADNLKHYSIMYRENKVSRKKRTKLSKEDKQQIREHILNNTPTRQLCKDYNVSFRTIYDIKLLNKAA